MPRILRRRTTSWPLLALVLVVSACTPPNTPIPPTVPPPTAVPVPTMAATNTKFCDGYISVSKLMLTSPLMQGPDSQSVAKDVVVSESQKLGAAIDDMKSNAPSELSAPLDQVSAAIKATASKGDASSLQADMDQPGRVVDAWVYDNCGWTDVPVTAANNAFQGLPATIAAGNTAFKLTNTSTDGYHVMMITRRKPGVTGTAKDILAKPGDPLQSDLEMLGAVAAPPGQYGVTALVLTPGDYIVLDPVPQGGIPQPGTAPAADAKQNYMLGMFGEFTAK
jgi:hypothetical protein